MKKEHAQYFKLTIAFLLGVVIPRLFYPCFNRCTNEVENDAFCLWSVRTESVAIPHRESTLCEKHWSKTHGSQHCGCNSREVARRAWNNTVYQHPCCMDRLRETFQWFALEMHLRKLRYLLHGEAVIGWNSSSRVLPYLDHIDISIRIDAWNSTHFQDVIDTLVSKHSVCVVWINAHRITITNFDNHLQLFLIQVVNGTAHSSWEKFTAQPARNLYPEQPVVFEGVSTYVPHDPVAYLDKYFGRKKWGTPLWLCESGVDEGSREAKGSGECLKTDDGAELWTVGAGPGGLYGKCKLHWSAKDGSSYCGCSKEEVEARKWNNSFYTHPCCHDRLKDSLRLFSQAMNERKLKYVLDGGGVIGWQRNKTFIPYDNDLDVTVRLDVWTSPKFQEVISELAAKTRFMRFLAQSIPHRD